MYTTITNHLGAFAAASSSVVGAGLAVAGQVPVPAGVSPDLVALVLTIGPPLTWLAYRLLIGIAAYYAHGAKMDRKKADRLEADADPGNDNLIEILRDRADRRDSMSSAFSAAEKKRQSK